MLRKHSLGRVSLVLVAIIVAGGILVAFVTPRSGAMDDLSPYASPAVVDSTTPLSSLASSYSVAGGTSFSGTTQEGTQPSTIILGGSTASQTSTPASSLGDLSATSANVTSSGTPSGTSGHSIEFFGNITVTVPDPSSALQQAGQIAQSLGGYVAQSLYGSSTSSITLRVPSDEYQAAMAQLESLGKVASDSTSSDDVTVQVDDLNATMQSLLTEQTSLLKLLGQSTSVNATLEIESYLQQTDAQIDSVESSLLQADQLVAYATIGVDMVQAETPAPLTLKLSGTPLSGLSPLSVTFNAVVSGGVTPYVVNFNFGDGTSAQGQQLIHEFAQPGTYNVTVSATDQSGNVTLGSILVRVSSPPISDGITSFVGAIAALFTRVVEGIAEVAVVVVPIVLVAYAAGAPAYRRYSRFRASERSAPTDGESEK